MDDNVLAAMARWPDVPDVYGWLSLSETGQWRVHPLGDACPQTQSDKHDAGSDAFRVPSGDPSPGEGITSPQILRFMDNNYGHDGQKQWFFQNGPQKVYVRLDAAPYILRTEAGSADNPFGLVTHNGLAVGDIHEWYLDDTGKLYAQTEHGPGLIAGRDLASVLDRLYTVDRQAVLEILERNPDWRFSIETTPLQVEYKHPEVPGSEATPSTTTTSFNFAPAAQIPQLLGFVRCPRPPI